MPYKISIPLAELVFLFFGQVGQKNVQKWFSRVALAELTAYRKNAFNILNLEFKEILKTINYYYRV